MSATAYRVALVGAGGISRHHSRACSLSDRVQLAAVCDISQAALGRYREQFPHVPAAYLDLDKRSPPAKPSRCRPVRTRSAETR